MTARSARQPSVLETWGLLLTFGTLLLVVLSVWGAGALGDAAAGRPVMANPFGYVIALMAGKRIWPGGWSTAVLVLAGLVVLAVAAVLVVAAVRRNNKAPTLKRIDAAAHRLGGPRDLAPLSPKGVLTSAQRLRPLTDIDPEQPEQHGRLLGRTVVGDMPVRASWEDLGCHIWGTRRGKTTSLTIPQSVEAPGALVATSNKRDLIDATREARAGKGRVWAFDPQKVATQPQEFWYNPLSRITSISSAKIVAGHFVTGTREPDAKTDSYFDGSAENLLASYLLAAAVGEKTLVDVYRWLTDNRDNTPKELLKNEHELVSLDVASLLQTPDKQRAGVFDTAKKLVGCLLDEYALGWVTPPKTPMPEFDPAQFVHSTDSLYLLSMEEAGSAAPLVACLTEHICHEAVQRANTMPLGRLDPPLLCQLDEAANVCKWRQLPSLYSHYGSRGVIIDVILQSWSQGEEVWGAGGMKKLWGAANIRTYGGGGAEVGYLRELVEQAGRDDYDSWTRSFDHQNRASRSVSGQQLEHLPVDLLSAMPIGRSVAICSGCPVFVYAPQRWMDGPHREIIQISIDKHDPGAQQKPQKAGV
jgi:hypothetical protein